MAVVAAEALPAVRGLRLGAAALLPPAAAAQRRQVEDLEAQEPGEPQPLPARRLPARGDAELPRAHELLDARRPRGVLAGRVRGRLRPRPHLAGRPRLRPREADLAEGPLPAWAFD